jgi:hypothetical protein
VVVTSTPDLLYRLWMFHAFLRFKSEIRRTPECTKSASRSNGP